MLVELEAKRNCEIFEKPKLWCLFASRFWKSPKHDLSFFFCSNALKVSTLLDCGSFLVELGATSDLLRARRWGVLGGTQNIFPGPICQQCTTPGRRKSPNLHSVMRKSRVLIIWFAANSSYTDRIHKTKWFKVAGQNTQNQEEIFYFPSASLGFFLFICF